MTHSGQAKAALFIDVQSFEGMSRQDAIAYRDAMGAHLNGLRQAGTPVVWVAIAPGGSKLLEPGSDSDNRVRDLDVLNDIGFTGHQEQFGNHDIYAEFIRDYGPRENEAVYRKPAMSALATPQDTRDMDRILEQAGIKQESAKHTDDHSATKYITPEQRETEFAGIFPEGRTLHDYLVEKGTTDLQLFGAVSKYCVSETALSAATKGFRAQIQNDLVLSWKYPVSANTREGAQLVWADFDHDALIRESLSGAAIDPARGYSDGEKAQIAQVHFAARSGVSGERIDGDIGPHGQLASVYQAAAAGGGDQPSLPETNTQKVRAPDAGYGK